MKDEMCASSIVRQSSRSPGLPSNTPSGQVSPKCDRCIHKYTSGSHYLPRSFSCVRFGSARCRSSLTPRGKTFLSAFRSAGGNGAGEIGLGFLKPGDTLSEETEVNRTLIWWHFIPKLRRANALDISPSSNRFSDYSQHGTCFSIGIETRLEKKFHKEDDFNLCQILLTTIWILTKAY